MSSSLGSHFVQFRAFKAFEARCLEGVARVMQGFCKSASRVFSGCSKVVLRVFNGCSKGILKTLRGVSRVHQPCIKGA